MTTRVPDKAQDMNSETIESLQELVRGLEDSVKYHHEAAKGIDDDFVAQTFREIASERKQICDNLSGFVALADEKPADDGTFGGTLRTIWTSFRTGLNGGDSTVVLIEAERAEDAIVQKFKDVLPEIAGNPINAKLNGYFSVVKNGHDRVKALRDAYQAK